MAIQKRTLRHFVNFFASKFNVSGQRSLLPKTLSPWNGKKLIDPLPSQTSLCLTLTFLSEVVIHNLQNCFCAHTRLSCLETTAELKRKPLDYFNYLHELIIVKQNDDFVCLSSKELKLNHNVTGSSLKYSTTSCLSPLKL